MGIGEACSLFMDTATVKALWICPEVFVMLVWAVSGGGSQAFVGGRVATAGTHPRTGTIYATSNRSMLSDTRYHMPLEIDA